MKQVAVLGLGDFGLALAQHLRSNGVSVLAVDQRRARLRDLKGIERQTWVQVEGFAKRFPIANEDLDRENGEKTSSVHFLRFELDGAEIAALKAGAAVAMGSDHGAYPHRVEALAPAVRDALVADLD